MKKTLFFSALIICFLSCDNKEKYQGKWSLDFLKLAHNEVDALYPTSFLIENDSIKFNYWSFNHWHKFPLKLKKNKLLFNNWDVNADIFIDTLFLKNSSYIKDDNDSILKWWSDKPITQINLPKTPSINFNKKNTIKYNQPNYYILFGKPNNKEEYKLQLNDKHSEISDLRMFLYTERASLREELIPFPSAILFIDKSSPLKFIEDIFYNLKTMNQLKVSLVNNINISYNDSIGLHYKYELLNKRLPYLQENDKYNTNTSKLPSPPPPPPPNFPMFENQDLKSKFILLKENNIYYNDSIISSSELKKTIKPWVEKNEVIFSLYDLDSTYGVFLEMNAIINSVYEEVREEHSKIKFNKPLKDLSREEMIQIKEQTPMKHIWDYSIEHFNHIVVKESSFYGLEATPIE